MLLALIDAVLIFTRLVILGVPGAAGLGALADSGTSTALWALGVFMAVQAIEGELPETVHPEPHGVPAPGHG